jgi:hypothetical protein
MKIGGLEMPDNRLFTLVLSAAGHDLGRQDLRVEAGEHQESCPLFRLGEKQMLVGCVEDSKILLVVRQL